METLMNESLNYKPPKSLNIADLEAVSLNNVIEDREKKDSEGKLFKYKVILVDGEEYRVPGPVLGAIKEILQEKPDLKTVKVKKKGEGINTKYTVVQLE